MLTEDTEDLDKRRCRILGGGESESDGRRVVRVIEIRQQMIGVDLILEHVDAGLEVVDLDVLTLEPVVVAIGPPC